ncbi:sulfatase-like hydrolase/transferase [Niabella aurantiaca]|uniref:sulfatase-like hydrolase/transferase n=1 Tax=Niabella aurantiaca TaxID=379900 RepID=UPI000379FCC2|nr:sulfatase-like hydrolase/transferase [Niabella aurantiaca]
METPGTVPQPVLKSTAGKASAMLILLLFMLLNSCYGSGSGPGPGNRRPNILFVIADDQSFPYASVYGCPVVQTPAFDQVAKTGILFNNAFAAAPQCSPSRAALLTGKNIWQLEEAGTHSSYFPKKFQVFPDLLEASGYAIGYTGKGWGPGNWKDAGWKRNPAGPEFNKKKRIPPNPYISNIDYSANFFDFFEHKKKDEPFFFWIGTHEPHRNYLEGSGRRSGKDLSRIDVPGFLPKDPVVQSDIADYLTEIEWFDKQLGKVIGFLKDRGELDHTLIVVTSDNGMPFPTAKANLMEYGTHVPLAMSWPGKIRPGCISDDLVSLIDLAPTFLSVAGLNKVPGITGKDLAPVLFNGKNREADFREFVVTGRERHSHSRPDNEGYPSRAIRTSRYLYIMNIRPDRWPAGDPPPGSDHRKPETLLPGFKPIGMGYNDIDDPSPTKEFLLKEQAKWPLLFAAGFEKRKEDQLFDIQKDPDCIHDLAYAPGYEALRTTLKATLVQTLSNQKDPRMTGDGDIFETYPRFGAMRDFPGFKEQGKYNTGYKKGKDDPTKILPQKGVRQKDKKNAANEKPDSLPDIPVVIIMADQLRSDALGAMTPHINALREEGVSFNRAYTASPICVPSRGSFFTGRYPNNTGSLLNGWEKKDEHFRYVKSGISNLYETMQSHWDSWHVGKQHFYTEDRIDEDPHSATTWILPADYKAWMEAKGVKPPGGKTFSTVVPQLVSGKYTQIRRYTKPALGVYREGAAFFHDNYYTDRSVEIIRKHKSDKPLLLNLMFYSPHPPFSIPEPYYSKVKPGELKLPDNVGAWYDHQSPLQLYNLSGFVGTQYDRSAWKEIWAKYLGLVNLLDDNVGRVIAALKESGLYDKALIIFTADHGEMLGSHSLWQKSCMYEESARVPLIIKFPSSFRPEIRASEELVSLIDVWPTLIDFLKIRTSGKTDGISLMPLLKNEKLSRSQVFIQYDGNAGYGNNQRSIVKGHYKLIIDCFKDEIYIELYDVIKDPEETRNLALTPEHYSTAKDMITLLKNHMRQTNDRLTFTDDIYDLFLKRNASAGPEQASIP